ncbi:MAG: hypothetical protein DRQ49_04710 [Gammaproteobacteria bacterium]|nr:MAG: hypothetical protein DRQ41_10605 [Gammaproteobacteria bacterium]RKZ41560.1 MAG: hypothetical protein DRQ49_04710 [Gammaproteobacteria bacterium]RKZ76255.1 MAG: hypothetical protein DRQ57_04640 [Gammaproteobacteria bacterium]
MASNVIDGTRPAKKNVSEQAMLHLLKTTLSCLLIIVIGGCGTTSSSQAEYKKSTTVPPLEVPPDLIGSTSIDEHKVMPDVSESTTFSNYSRTRSHGLSSQSSKVKVLPLSETVQIKHDGNIRWLLLQTEPAIFWPKVKQFWLKNGFTLKIENAAIGIMETEWSENRADIPQEGIRKYLGKALSMLYSAPTRDKFRVRLERGHIAGTTELYITHRGAEEVARGNNFTWQNRPSEPELEAEMLNRLMVFIGVEKEQAETLLAKTEKKEPTSRAHLIHKKEGQVDLMVQEDFARTWRRTGLALDHLGFTLEDRNRSSGLYLIRYIDPDKEKGFFARIFGGKKEKDNQVYRINLLDESSTTRIVVLNNQGKISSNKTAERILTLLHEQLK